MKQLTIVRHAKSSWNNFELSDHDRPLKDVGVKKTNKIINYLKDQSYKPDLIISSTAVRASQTAIQIAVGLGYDKSKIRYEKSIYHAGIDDIFTEVFSVDNKIDSVMVVGHNPTLTDFVNEYLNPEIDNLPTTGTVSIEFDTERWENIVDAKFKVKFVVFPKMLR